MLNQTLHDDITAQFRYYKAHKSSRFTRLLFADDAVEFYFEQNGQIPPTTALDRLATLILHDEMSDMRKNKMSATEFPIMSARQQESRHKKETSSAAAIDCATDGRNYRENSRDSRRKYRETFGI